MNFALLLIALGFGYKIYLEASTGGKNRTKQLGKIIGVAIMLISFLGTLCALSCAMATCGSKACPMGGKHGGGFGMPFKSKGSCPLMMKGGAGSEMPEIPSADYVTSIKDEMNKKK